jgi:hypothetical protein
MPGPPPAKPGGVLGNRCRCVGAVPWGDRGHEMVAEFASRRAGALETALLQQRTRTIHTPHFRVRCTVQVQRARREERGWAAQASPDHCQQSRSRRPRGTWLTTAHGKALPRTPASTAERSAGLVEAVDQVFAVTTSILWIPREVQTAPSTTRVSAPHDSAGRDYLGWLSPCGRRLRCRTRGQEP